MDEHATKVYRPEELMEVLHIGRGSVYRLLRAGTIRSVRIGKLYRIPAICLEEYLHLGYNGKDPVEGLSNEGS